MDFTQKRLRKDVLKCISQILNETFLIDKVALLFGVIDICQRQELVNMLITHEEDNQ